MMLFSVYPQGPPVYQPPIKKGPNPWLIALGFCGGCVVLGLIASVALGFFAYNKSKGLFQGILEQPQKMQSFLTYVRDHRYAEARSLMSPEGQQALSEADLKQMEADMEKKLGRLESWGKPGSPNSQADTSDPNNRSLKSLSLTYTYRLKYAKGEGKATFEFHSTDPLKLSSAIASFDLEAAHAGRKKPAASDSSDEPAGKGETSGGNKDDSGQ